MKHKLAEKHIAACLAGEQKPDVDFITGLAIWPDPKRTLMTVMGVSFPEEREAYFGLARTLNYKVAFPHYVLKRILDGAEPSPDKAPPENG